MTFTKFQEIARRLGNDMSHTTEFSQISLDHPIPLQHKELGFVINVLHIRGNLDYLNGHVQGTVRRAPKNPLNEEQMSKMTYI